MPNTIPVNCTYGGCTIENVAFLPGLQNLICPKCGKTTYIKITDEGRFYTSNNKAEIMFEE